MLSGLFDEVSSHRKTAEEDIKTMIKSFGGEVKKSYSKNTGEIFKICLNKSLFYFLFADYLSFIRLSACRKES